MEFSQEEREQTEDNKPSILWTSLADYEAADLAKARVTTYGYDTQGNQTAITYPDGTSELCFFDAENRKTWSQDRRGYRTFFTYDAVGRLRFTIHPDANDGTSASAPNSPTDSRLSDNPRTEVQYDLIGRVRFQIDERGAKTEFTYEDNCGCAMRRRSMIQHLAAGNLTTYYAYDGAGNVRYVTDPRGHETETQYDNRGRPTFVIHPATDEHPSTKTETRYDALGRRVAVIDQEGKLTRYRYDGLGRLVEVRQYLDQSIAADDADFSLAITHASVVSTRYSYDELGSQVTQTDALGRVTTYWTDTLGRRTKRILPKDAAEATALAESLQYDSWGNLWKRTDFAGKTTTFGYDALNRLKSKTADATHPSLGYSHAIARIEYDYDANGDRTAARTYNATDTLLYSESTPRDERGRVDYKDAPGGRLDYSYHANGLLKDVVSGNTSGVNIGYRYDALNRLEHVDDATTGTTLTSDYTYNPNGSLETLTQANGVVHTYGYDALNRLRTLTVAKGATSIHAYEYKLNPSGHRRQVVEGAKTTTYAYDTLYRLTGETIAGATTAAQNGTIGYLLDKVGNRQSRTSSVPAVSTVLDQTYNARDWRDGDSYNANGSTTTSPTLPQVAAGFTDAYDFEERLIVRNRADGTSINLNYDADGIRTSKHILDATGAAVTSTHWLVDTNNLTGYAQVLEERITTSAATTLRAYTYGSALISRSETPITAVPTWSVLHYAPDGHGNIRELTDATGAVTDSYTYDAFGNVVFSSGPTANNYLYCGEQYDPDLGLYYNRARYLNTDSGRFWSLDDFEGSDSDPLTLHKYLYANCDPVNGSDPSGLFTLVELIESMGANEIIEASRIIIANRGRKKAVQIIGCVVGTEGIKRAINYEMHHPIPFSMGGPDRNLIPLPTETHRMFHFVLNILIKADPEFKGFSNYSSADKWSEKLVGATTKRAMLALIEQAARYVDKQCKLPKPFRIIDYVERNKKEWLKP